MYCTNQFNPKTEDSSSNKKLEHSLLYLTSFYEKLVLDLTLKE